MTHLLLMLVKLVHRANIPSADERYLAQSVDAHDLEVRQRALERRTDS